MRDDIQASSYCFTKSKHLLAKRDKGRTKRTVEGLTEKSKCSRILK